MPSIVSKLKQRELITPPKYVDNSIQYEVMMGSVAYGVSSAMSDVDVYGFCIPPKDIIFPHLRGVILGFDDKYPKFNQYQQHHIEDKTNKRDYDLTIYNIVRYFRLCANGNPNMIDSLFVPRRCVLHITQIGEMVREKRHLFLSKKCWHTHKGYAFSQLSKMAGKNSLGVKIRRIEEQHGLDSHTTYDDLKSLNFEWGNVSVREEYLKLLKELSETKSTRHQMIRELGIDYKFAYHVVRLIDH